MAHLPTFYPNFTNYYEWAIDIFYKVLLQCSDSSEWADSSISMVLPNIY
jgi:hypothetical protein